MGPKLKGGPQQPSAEAGVPRMGLRLTDSQAQGEHICLPVNCFCSCIIEAVAG